MYKSSLLVFNMIKHFVLLFVCASFIGVDSYLGQWVPPSNADVRGPCPALNTLANHGYLPRTGKDITVDMVVEAVSEVFTVNTDFATLMAEAGVAAAGVDGLLDLNKLSDSSVEHDASMTRNDRYFGDNNNVNLTLLDGLLASSSDGEVLTPADFANYQSIRQNHSIEFNPEYSLSGFLVNFTSAEPALILTVFGSMDENGDFSVPVSFVDSVFGLEKLPPDWTGAQSEVTEDLVTELAAIIRSMWTSVWPYN